MEICRSHGLELEEKPKEATKSGLTLLKYQSSQEQQKIAELNKKISELEETVANLTSTGNANAVRLRDMIKEQERLKKELEAERADYDKAVAQINDAEDNIKHLLLIINADYEELNQAVTKTALSKTEEPRKASAELLREIKTNAKLNDGFFGNGKMKIQLLPSVYKKLLKSLEQQEQLLLLVEKYKALLIESKKRYDERLQANQNDDSRQRSAPIKKTQQKDG